MKKKPIKQGMTFWFGGMGGGVPTVRSAFVTGVINGRVYYLERGQMYADRIDAFRFWFLPTYRKACRRRDETVAHELERQAR